MRIEPKKSVAFRAEDGDELRIGYDNRGDPYRQGIYVSLEKCDQQNSAYLFLEDHEARQLRDLLNTLYPTKATS